MEGSLTLLLVALSVFTLAIGTCLVRFIVRHVLWRRRRRRHREPLSLVGIPVVSSDLVPRKKMYLIDPSKVVVDGAPLLPGGVKLYVHPDDLRSFAAIDKEELHG